MTQNLARLFVRLQPEIDWVPQQASSYVPNNGDDRGLSSLLRVHNGLSAYKGGLRIFGAERSLLPSLAEWNVADLWRCEYRGLDRGIPFFAEDFLGNQFGFENRAVVRFLAETGDIEIAGKSFEDWLQRIVEDPVEELTLWLLDDWRSANRPPILSEHLCPKIPFVVKGPTERGNLYLCDRVESMRFKGSFAHQIRDVPTGGQIEIRVK